RRGGGSSEGGRGRASKAPLGYGSPPFNSHAPRFLPAARRQGCKSCVGPRVRADGACPATRPPRAFEGNGPWRTACSGLGALRKDDTIMRSHNNLTATLAALLLGASGLAHGAEVLKTDRAEMDVGGRLQVLGFGQSLQDGIQNDQR